MNDRTKEAEALHALIWSDPSFHGENGVDVLRESYEKLAKWKYAPGMVELGTIYCGEHENMFAELFPGLIPQSDKSEEGFRLIEEGAIIAERAARNPLSYLHYNEIVGAYHRKTKMLRASNSFGVDFLKALAKKMDYEKKKLIALQEAICQFPEDAGTLGAMVELSKKNLENHKEELRLSISVEATKGADLSALIETWRQAGEKEAVAIAGQELS
jgi:hypothetical protein